MRVLKLLLVAWLVALVWAVAAAPAPRAGGGTRNPRPAPTSCPTVTVGCQRTGLVGQPITFTANISGGDPAVTPRFNWTVSAGTITSGQETSQLTVGPFAQGGKVQATVEIGGYESFYPCPMTASCTTNIVSDPTPLKFGEYGSIPFEGEKKYLDDFAGELRNDYTSRWYLVCYGGRQSGRDEARSRCDRAKSYLVDERGYTAARIVTLDGGLREEPTVEMWVVPPGFNPPASRPNESPSVELVPSADMVVLDSGCAEGTPGIRLCKATSPKVALRAKAADPDGDTLLYTYTTTGGRINGDGPEVTLDLTGIAPGTFTVTLKVDDGNGGIATDEATVTASRCSCPLRPPPPPQCPTVTVSCPDGPAKPGGSITFTANVSGGDPNVTPTFNWTVSAGTISSGRGTGSVTVDTGGVASNSSITAIADVGGYDRSCQTVASCTLHPGAPPPVSRKVDEYGNVKLKDEWARLDEFAAGLRDDPTAQGYFVCYGGRRSTAGEAQRRCDRALRYTSRYPWASDPARLVTVDAGYRCEPSVELWVVPSGAEPPADAPLTVPAPKPSASKCRPPRRRPRR